MDHVDFLAHRLEWRKVSARFKRYTNRYSLLLGATGAIAGFFASSLVNYNFGDGEVALVFWWLMGIVVALTISENGQDTSRLAR